MKKTLIAAALATSTMLGATASNAAYIQLGFILDSSGSIGSGNWSTITTGLGNAILDIPFPSATQLNTYLVSVVKFSTSATLEINDFAVTDASTRTALSNLVKNIAYSGGNTNFAAAFSTMTTALTDATGLATAASALASYVNFTTDGQQNTGGTGYAEQAALVAAGIDNISVEGIGSGVDVADLTTNFCYPGPCDTTSPYNFPTQGFYIGVANATAYAAAIGNKVRVVTQQVPEPASIALMGLGLLGLGALRRRQKA